MSTNSKTTSEDTIISADEVRAVRRGRKAEVNTALVDLLKKVKVGQAVALAGTFGEVPTGNPRQSVSGKIRRHAAMAWGDEAGVAINYSPEGVPQVTRKS